LFLQEGNEENEGRTFTWLNSPVCFTRANVAQICRIAGFQPAGRPNHSGRHADWEVGDTADSEVCATLYGGFSRFSRGAAYAILLADNKAKESQIEVAN
jgi:hypothetical protein